MQEAQQDARQIVTQIAEDVSGRGLDIERNSWPFEKGEPVEYVPSAMVEDIAFELIDKLEWLYQARGFEIIGRYRYKENWKKNGKTKYGELKKATGLLQHFAQTDFILMVNYIVWVELTPWQKVALVYHELKHAGSDVKDDGTITPTLNPHDLELFYDEIELFGTQTYKDWEKAAEAAEAGRGVTPQFHLNLTP